MKWVKRVLIIAIALTLVNDAGRYLMAIYKVDDRARAISFEAAVIARANAAANSGWPTTAAMAKEAGVEVTAYKQDATGVTLSIRLQVVGTWLIGPSLAIMGRKPLSTPFPLDRTASSQG